MTKQGEMFAMSPEATRIIELRAENFKRLEAVEIHPRGNVVDISGRNRQGKSSVLDAISLALGGKEWAGKKPIRDGADKGKIVVTLDNGMTVTRTITESGGSLTITSTDGAKYPSPQAMLDKLVGDLSFDPMMFCMQDTKTQAATLKSITGVDTAALDAERARVFAERTETNRDLKRVETVANSLKFHQDAPEAEQSVSELMENLKAALKSTADAGMAVKSYEAAKNAHQLAKDEVERLRAALTSAESTEARAGDAVKVAFAAAKELKEKMIPIEPLQQQVDSIEETNAKVRSNRERSQKLTEVSTLEATAAKQTKRLAEIDAEKAKMLAEAKFPIEGLSVDDSGVLYNGIPFDQASSYEQIRVSTAISLAMSPRMPIALIRNGSLIDEDGLAIIAEVAKERDAQVWIEHVDKGGAIGIVIEDGKVAKVN